MPVEVLRSVPVEAAVMPLAEGQVWLVRRGWGRGAGVVWREAEKKRFQHVKGGRVCRPGPQLPAADVLPFT